nr:MATE family efflux transporter [Romboutsia sp. Marseille-P6047]
MVYPIINLLIGVGVMFSTGRGAIVAKLMGEGKDKEAKEGFTSIAISGLVVGCIVSLICIIFIDKIIYTLGGNDQLYKYCYDYLLWMLIFTPFLILKIYSDYFLITAGVAKLGLINAIGGGVLNIVLDYIFLYIFKMGITSAAIATGLGYGVPSIIGIIHFSKKSSAIHFVKFKFNFKLIKLF